MNIHQFRNNFRRIKNAWIPRQSRRTVDGKPKGPNATEAKYLREIITPTNDSSMAFRYQPDPIVITRTTSREYTADFLTQEPYGRLVYHEVKGSYHLPTHDRARLAWEIAAEAHPEWDFVWAELTRKGWEIERWEDGGRVIAVHYAGTPMDEWHTVAADWRRRKMKQLNSPTAGRAVSAETAEATHGNLRAEVSR